MRKITALILILAMCFALFGCSSGDVETTPTTEEIPQLTSAPTKPTIPPTTEPETQPQETYPKSGIYGDNLVLGNYTFIIPDGFYAQEVGEDSYALVSNDETCVIGLAAFDIGTLNEETVQVFIESQNKNFIMDNDFLIGEIDGSIGDTEIKYEYYSDILSDPSIESLVCTFTDSWYTYTIKLSSIGIASFTDGVKTFSYFCSTAEHNGRESRFDFVQ